MTVDRPSWDEYFMEIARLVARRSTCLRRQVGAVMVKEKNILATGYNGTPSGIRHCAEVGCLRQQLGVPSGERHELCRGLHAEQNAIIQAAKHGVNIDGASLYCTNSPCIICTKFTGWKNRWWWSQERINTTLNLLIFKMNYLTSDLLPHRRIGV